MLNVTHAVSSNEHVRRRRQCYSLRFGGPLIGVNAERCHKASSAARGTLIESKEPDETCEARGDGLTNAVEC